MNYTCSTLTQCGTIESIAKLAAYYRCGYWLCGWNYHSPLQRYHARWYYVVSSNVFICVMLGNAKIKFSNSLSHRANWNDGLITHTFFYTYCASTYSVCVPKCWKPIKKSDDTHSRCCCMLFLYNQSRWVICARRRYACNSLMRLGSAFLCSRDAICLRESTVEFRRQNRIFMTRSRFALWQFPIVHDG